MTGSYRNSLLIIFASFSLIFLAGLQISLINQLDWGFNIFLIVTLFLAMIKNFYWAIFSAWIGGFFIDTVRFSAFGVTSLILLILVFFLILFQKKALVTAKIESILIISFLAVFFYRFLEWIINDIFSVGQEQFSFYFFNSAFAAEFFLSAALLLAVFKYRRPQNV